MKSELEVSNIRMTEGRDEATAFFEPEGRLRLRWRVALFLCGFAGVQVCVGVLAGLGLVAFAAAPFFLLGVGLLVTLCRRFVDRRTLGSLGLGQPRQGWPGTVLYGMGLGSVPILIAVGILLGLGALRFDGVTTSWQTWALVPALLVMAFVEELVFRGYLLANLLEARTTRFGVVVSSLLFWMSHALNPAAWSSPLVPLNLFGAGVVLALAYLESGNLWFPTLVHFAWNLTQGVLFEIPVSGLQTDGVLDVGATVGLPTWLAGGSFGLEASLPLTVTEAALVLLLLWRLRRKGAPVSLT